MPLQLRISGGSLSLSKTTRVIEVQEWRLCVHRGSIASIPVAIGLCWATCRAIDPTARLVSIVRIRWWYVTVVGCETTRLGARVLRLAELIPGSLLVVLRVPCGVPVVISAVPHVPGSALENVVVARILVTIAAACTRSAASDCTGRVSSVGVKFLRQVAHV